MNIQYHIWGVLAHGMLCENSDKKNFVYELPPITEWTEGFCEALNHITYGKKIPFHLPDADNLFKLDTDHEIWNIFRFYDSIAPVEKCYIATDLPVSYVRFTDTVILQKADEGKAKECSESIRKGLGLLLGLESHLHTLMENNESLAEDKDCLLLQKICALRACISIDYHNESDGKKERPQSDHNVWHELLQNVNDHIDSKGVLDIKLDHKTLTLSYQERACKSEQDKCGGFTTRDFFAVCTSGNSGNIVSKDESARNIEAEGHKGTGFKSVYNFFSKVQIESGNVTCILDNTQYYEYSQCLQLKDNDEIKLNHVSEIKITDKRYFKPDFPIPEFTFDKTHECTTITLTFADDTKKENFLRESGLDGDSFEITPTYYFLKNIQKIKFNSSEYDLAEYISDNFDVYEDMFEVDETLLKKNPRWESKTCQDFIDAKKNIVHILFPKNLAKEPSTENCLYYTRPTEKCLYCTLPITEKTFQTPFYINCPALELMDNRKALSEGNLKNWNDRILEKALQGENSCFEKIFTAFAEKYPDTAYLYFPYEYLRGADAQKWACLDNIPFIRTVINENEEPQLMSLSQWYTALPDGKQTVTEDEWKDGFVFLPQYLYDWFQAKGGLNGFSCSVPFVYYGKDNDCRDIRGVQKLGETLDTQKVLRNLFPKKESSVGIIIQNIWDYFGKRYYVERDACLTDKDEADIKLLQALHGDDIYYEDITNKKCYCYQCYLGKTICESKVHALGAEEIGEYQSITGYQEQIGEKFTVDEAQFKQAFSNIREELYRIRIKDETQGETQSWRIVDTEDTFLNAFIAKNLQEKVFEQAKKLECLEDVDILPASIQSLLKSGKVAVKLGDESYRYSNAHNLYRSSKQALSDKKFIVREPDWVKRYFPDLDDEVKKKDFFSKTTWEILCEIIPAYQDDTDVAKAIIQYLEDTIDVPCEKKEKLFDKLLEWNVPIKCKWEKWCKKYIRQYMNYAKERILEKSPTNLKFIFENNILRELPKQFIDKFNDRVEQKKKETKYGVLGNLEKSLEELIKDIQYYENDGEAFGYCIGYKDSDSETPYLVTLGEKGVGKLLRDVFDCDQYLIPKQHTSMDCFPVMPLFKSYDTWDANQIKNALNSFQIPEDENELKLPLVNRFEMKIDNRWYCFAGYGAGEYIEKRCPICGGILIAETSMLRIRSVKAVQGEYVPVLICSNCHQAFSYAQNIFLCKRNGDPYESQKELMDALTSTNPVYINFIMSTFECKIFELPMTFLHRVICLKILKSKEEQE